MSYRIFISSVQREFAKDWKRNHEPESLVPLSREQVREQVANVRMEVMG